MLILKIDDFVDLWEILMLILKTRFCDESKILAVIPNNKISSMKEFFLC
jgi:hypothetical protein